MRRARAFAACGRGRVGWPFAAAARRSRHCAPRGGRVAPGSPQGPLHGAFAPAVFFAVFFAVASKTRPLRPRTARRQNTRAGSLSEGPRDGLAPRTHTGADKRAPGSITPVPGEAVRSWWGDQLDHESIQISYRSV